jgi:hypothetical protein
VGSEELLMEFDQSFAPCPGGQKEAWHDRSSSMVFVEGGWMGGKTWLGARMLMDAHLCNAIDEDGLPTGVPSVMVGASLSLMADTMIPHVEEAAKEMGTRVEYRSQIRVGERPLRGVLLLPDISINGVLSYIICRTAERPDLITGWEVGAAWGDEATRWRENRIEPKKDPYIQLLGRVRHPRARFHRTILTYTNEGDATRVYEEARSGAPGTRLYRARTQDNPLAVDWMNAQLAAGRLTPELAEQYFGGGAVRRRGKAVYAAFEDGRPCVTDDVGFDPALPLDLSMDFNVAPGMHGLLSQHRTGLDLIDVFDELHGPGWSVPDLIAEFARRWQAMPARPAVRVFGDPAGNQRTAQTGKTHWYVVKEALEHHRIPFEFRVRPAHAPVPDGVNAVNAAFRAVDGRCHLRVHPRCKRLRDDLRRLRYDDKGAVDKLSDPTVGHLCDSLRYMVEMLRPCVLRPAVVPGGRVSVRGIRGVGT